MMVSMPVIMGVAMIVVVAIPMRAGARRPVLRAMAMVVSVIVIVWAHASRAYPEPLDDQRRRRRKGV